LAGRPGDLFALKKDAILARPCAASAASVFGFFLKRGNCLAPFRPPIAKLKNSSFTAAEKKGK
jgi:hypothetical protein